MYHIFVHSFINFILLNSVQFQIPVSNAGRVDQPLGSPAGQGCDVSSPAGQGCDVMPQLPFISASSVIRRVSPAGQGCGDRSVFMVNLTKHCCSCRATVIRQNLKIRSLQRQVTYTVCCNNVIS
jgi:hypothetical protein